MYHVWQGVHTPDMLSASCTYAHWWVTVKCITCVKAFLHRTGLVAVIHQEPVWRDDVKSASFWIVRNCTESPQRNSGQRRCAIDVDSLQCTFNKPWALIHRRDFHKSGVSRYTSQKVLVTFFTCCRFMVVRTRTTAEPSDAEVMTQLLESQLAVRSAVAVLRQR